MPPILLIDDDPLFHYLVQRYTERSGCDFVSVQSGIHALATVQQIQPALIVLDVALPPDDGWHVLEQLKANHQTHAIPVVMCANELDQARAWDEGADYCLPKPLMYNEFIHVLLEVGIPVSINR